MGKNKQSNNQLSKKTKTTMWQEHKADNRRNHDDRIRLSMALSLYGRLFGGRTTFSHGQVRVRIQTRGERPSPEALKTYYKQAAAELSEKYPKAIERTWQEDAVRRALKELGTNFVLASAWLGRNNIDLLLPGLTALSRGSNHSGVRFTGVAIEVDGGVHDFTPKALGDFTKDNLLSFIGILPHRIRNEHIHQKTILNALSEMCIYSAMDSRAKRRMWTRIHLTTIFLNWKASQLEDVFGFNYELARNKILNRLSLTGEI